MALSNFASRFLFVRNPSSWSFGEKKMTRFQLFRWKTFSRSEFGEKKMTLGGSFVFQHLSYCHLFLRNGSKRFILSFFFSKRLQTVHIVIFFSNSKKTRLILSFFYFQVPKIILSFFFSTGYICVCLCMCMCLCVLHVCVCVC